MGDHNNYEIGFQTNCESSGMSVNPYFSSAWDQVESFGGSSMVSQSEFNTNTYQAVSNYPSDHVEMLPKFSSYGSGSFSDMVGSFGLTDCSQIAATCRDLNGLDSREDHRSSEEPMVGNSPNGRGRKRLAESSSPNDSNKNEPRRDHSSDVVKEQDEKKSRTEQNSASNSRGKQAVNPSKESSHSGEAPKENYIHVRARRGQATNSHSLAERVRREKISERMRLLQELVPGCNKITGKAVMLDEIINYVQSLQQQVEFLSMKLATVNPELNIDIDRILSKDIIHSRGSNAGIMGSSPGMSIHPFSHGFFPANIPVIPNSNLQFSSVPHAVLENDLQNLLQVGFDSSSAVGNLGSSGRLKPEL